MSPYMPIRFDIVERHCDHISIEGLSVAGVFSFFISSFLIFFFFLRLFLPFFSSFLGFVFSLARLCNC